LLVAKQLEDGILVKAIDFALPGYGFYLAYQPEHPHKAMIDAFVEWARRVD
jgi:hypothetical protein